jgi:hypothetical protein
LELRALRKGKKGSRREREGLNQAPACRAFPEVLSPFLAMRCNAFIEHKERAVCKEKIFASGMALNEKAFFLPP